MINHNDHVKKNHISLLKPVTHFYNQIPGQFVFNVIFMSELCQFIIILTLEIATSIYSYINNIII